MPFANVFWLLYSYTYFMSANSIGKKVIYTPKHFILISEYKISKTTSGENKPLNIWGWTENEIKWHD